MTTDLMNSIWARLVTASADALRMTDAETKRFYDNRVARLVGLLPFIAICDDAERSALSHLATFVVANRGEARRAFDHAPADDEEPLARLRTISDFKGGNEAILARGLALLGLCMVSGYRRDAQIDACFGNYNPVNEVPESADNAEVSFRSVLAGNQPNVADIVLPLDDAVQAYWEPYYA